MSKRRTIRRPARRGLVARSGSLLLGAIVAAGMIVAMQIPLLAKPAVAQLTSSVVGSKPSSAMALDWPSTGSAALVVPSLGVSQTHRDPVVPIASLTKMMTAYVTLRKLPLALGQSGPCLKVRPRDVATYEQMKLTDQSRVAVASGESLCEIELLGGLLVHSANNYAVLLARMVARSTPNFVAMMNHTARSLGLSGTHYADVSGFNAASVSTALDQATLAQLIMKSPLVRSLVDRSSITLPVAGTVGTFTPYVGLDDVIGVKSGLTFAAGGCDVMAMSFQQGSTTKTLYVVVLGQRGGNPLGQAGVAALALAKSAVTNQVQSTFARGATVGTLGWGHRVTTLALVHSAKVMWWSGQRRLTMTLQMKRFTKTVHRGQLVGWLIVHGLRRHRFALEAGTTVSPLPLWQRLL